MAPKLLMIDDHTGITKVVGLVAVALGMEYKALNVSVFATETFIDYRPDIVIIDMHMPEKDGVDVLNEVMTTGIPTQIVLTSGYGEGLLRLGEDIVKFHGMESVSILKKPFRRNELIELLTNIASGTAQERPSAPPLHS